MKFGPYGFKNRREVFSIRIKELENWIADLKSRRSKEKISEVFLSRLMFDKRRYEALLKRIPSGSEPIEK